MSFITDLISKVPELFIFLAIAIGTVLGSIRFRNFAIGATACILLVAVALGQLGTFTIAPMLRSIFFGLFVFSIGFKAGPEFFASLSFRTLSQVALALVIGLTGLAVVLGFAFALHFDAGTAAGVAAGSLTQSSMLGTATGSISQLTLPVAEAQRLQANIAAGFAVTYILGYILVLLFVPFVAPVMMGINLKDEAVKLEAELSGGAPPKSAGLGYRKFQARAFRVTTAAGKTVGEIEKTIGRRCVLERVVRKGKDFEPDAGTVLQSGDDIVLAGPTAAVLAAEELIGYEIDGENILRSIPGEVLEVLVNARDLHGLSLRQLTDRIGDVAHGVFLRSVSRHGQELPIGEATRIYVGDVMTLVGTIHNLNKVAARIGQALRLGDKIDVAFLAYGIAAGLLLGFFSLTIGNVPLTLGGGGGVLVAGLVCGWLHSRRPNMGAIPPAAQQTMISIGLGGFLAAIGLTNGPAALAAVQAQGILLLVVGMIVTLVPMIVGTLFARYVLHMNPVIICGALAGAMTVDAAVSGACEVAQSQTPVLGVAVPYAIANVFLTMLGPIIVSVLVTV